MDNRTRIKKFFALLDEIDAYGRAVGKMNFDLECCAPEEGMEQAGEDIALVSRQIFKLSHSKRYVSLLTALHEDGTDLTDLQKKAVEHLWEEYAKSKNITPQLDYEMDCAYAKAYTAWLKAKKAADFSLFRDSFADLVRLTRLAVSLRDEQKATVYDTLLDDFEKGGSIAQLDAFFDAIKARVIPLVKRIKAEGKPIRTDFLSRPVSIPVQESLSRRLMELQGLRKTATILMTTEHPFTDHYGPNDVRITTHYYENMFFSNVFTTLHEGGHALFMQYEPKENYDNHTSDEMTSAMHECISRFYENLIGRSRAFTDFLLPMLRELDGDPFADVSAEELYEAVNVAEPQPIRVEADELTYCLHILVRYELEKAFVNGEITVDEIPALWNAKYREYLGIDPKDDAEGCLQDVHWSGSYGYFPSYALGNAYGAQILRTMQKDFDVYAAVRAGDLAKILDWLKEHVFAAASLMTPDEWIRSITGESLDVRYYLDYLEEKFTKLYGLK